MGISKGYFGSIGTAKWLFKKQAPKDFPPLSFISPFVCHPLKNQAVSYY
jgi:hypothetical protein